MFRLVRFFCLSSALALVACSAESSSQKEEAVTAVAPPEILANATVPIEVRACDSGAVVALEPLEGDHLRLIHKEKTWTLKRIPAGQGSHYGAEGVDWRVRINEGQEVGQLLLTDEDGQPNVIEQCSRPAPVLAAAPRVRSMPPCISPDLAYGVEAGDAGMGHRLTTIRVENRGAQPCQLDGAPQVSLIDANGQAIDGVKGELLTQGYFGKVRTGVPILLAPSGKAYFDMGWSVIPHEAEGEASCPQSQSLRLAPPEDNGGKTLDLAIAACGGKLELSPYRVVADRQMATVHKGR